MIKVIEVEVRADGDRQKAITTFESLVNQFAREYQIWSQTFAVVPSMGSNYRLIAVIRYGEKRDGET